MSDSNRGVLAAFAGIAALLVATGAGAFYGSLYSPAKKQYTAVDTGSSPGETYQGVTKSLPDIALIPDPVERAMANPSPNSGEDHEKRDLAAQESMAAWAFYMALFAGMTALITGVGTYFIAAQVKLTREAVEDTSKATDAMVRQNELAENSQRPWINIKLKNWTPISLADGRLTGEVFFEVENVGQTPANCVQIFNKISANTFNAQDVTPFYEEKARDHSEGQWGDILPPQGWVQHKISLDIEVTDSLLFRDEGLDVFLPCMAIVATYCAVGSSKPLQTGMCYVVGMMRNGNLTAFFNEPGVYDQQRVVLAPHPGASIIT